MALAFSAALGSALMAGVFYAFSTFVMGALSRLPSTQGIAAMQSINIVVINPWFMAVFLGTAGLGVALATAGLLRGATPGGVECLAGSALYLGGVIAVTMWANVPLNDALARVDPTTTEAASLWTRYLHDWTFWNHVRAGAGLLAAAAWVVAMLRLRMLGPS